MSKPTVGSLFSGIGGMDLGLERAGFEVIWQSEIDPYASRVLKKHWPDVPNLGDIRTIDWSGVERPDLVCGGFPCQDISYAGKGAGLDGERSGLWWEFARAVRHLGPDCVLVENVAALLTRGLDAVLGTLASLGYDAEWGVLPAAAFGAPHIRERVFLLAYAQRAERGPLAESGFRLERRHSIGLQAGRNQENPAPGNGRQDVADAQSLGCRKGRPGRTVAHGEGGGRAAFPAVSDAHEPRPQGRRFGLDETPPQRQAPPILGSDPPRRDCPWWVTEPNVGRVADGVPSRVDRLRGLGNAVVPQVAEWIGRRILESMALTSEAR